MKIYSLIGVNNRVGEGKLAIETVATVSGIATFYATMDGTALGAPIFDLIEHIEATAIKNTTSPIEYLFCSVKEIDGVTITINVGNGVDLTGDGNTIANAPDSTQIMVKVIGTRHTPEE